MPEEAWLFLRLLFLATAATFMWMEGFTESQVVFFLRDIQVTTNTIGFSRCGVYSTWFSQCQRGKFGIRITSCLSDEN